MTLLFGNDFGVWSSPSWILTTEIMLRSRLYTSLKPPSLILGGSLFSHLCTPWPSSINFTKPIFSFFIPFYFFLETKGLTVCSILGSSISMFDSSSSQSPSSLESELVPFALSSQHQTSKSLSVSLVLVVRSLLSFTSSWIELRSQLALDFLFLKD